MTLALLDGSVFASRYRVVRRIAMGGMGAVYEVMHLETERRLALKVMLPHIVQSEDMRDRFRREARVAAHVQSEHIVDVFDAGIDDQSGAPFIVMELLRGEEVSVALRRVGRFGPADVVTILHQVSLALDKTHRSNIVHRDLKPENLFLTEREDGQLRVKVLDFGIAKLVAEGSTQDPGTRSLGTPLYMAPEQFRSGQPISPTTDVYALGMIAFTMLTGASYWAEEAKNSSNIFIFAGSVMAGPKEAASERARRLGVPLPPAFDAWFARATALMPQDRWPSAGQAIAALSDTLGVPRPALPLNLSSSGPLRQSGPLPPMPPMPAPAEEAATMIYAGSGPQPPTAGAAAGPHPPSATGAGYGSITGTATSVSPGRNRILVAVAAGVTLGAVGLAAIVLIPGSRSVGATGPAGSAIATAAASASEQASAAATVSVPTPPQPATSASATSASATSASATPPAATVAPATAAPAQQKVIKKTPPPPPPPGKKSIYVRD